MKRAVLPGLAALALIASSLAVWHWRFIAVPGLLPETRIADPLVGWGSGPHHRHEVVDNGGRPVLRLRRNRPGGKNPLVYIWLGPLEDVRFIHTRCEYRWRDVVPGPNSWMIARYAVSMKDDKGKISHPPDSKIFLGSGTREWTTAEAVLELTGDMADTQFAIGMLGASGLLEVRNLSLTAVRQRSWVPAATVLVVLGWVAFCTGLIRAHRVRPAIWRAVAAGAVVVAFSWVMVFPQTKGLSKPVLDQFAIGNSATGAAPAARPPAPPLPVPPRTVPDTPPHVAEQVPPPPPPQPEAGPSTPASDPPPEVRNPGFIPHLRLALSKGFPIAHLVLFTAFTLSVLLLTGSGSQWSLPLVVAFLSELVPAITQHIGDWTDWSDLLQNLLGIGLALILWAALDRWLRRRTTRSAPDAPARHTQCGE